jgi:hypothetical protein
MFLVPVSMRKSKYEFVTDAGSLAHYYYIQIAFYELVSGVTLGLHAGV